MRTNIFRNSYEQPENKLTYAFFSLLEHLSIGAALHLLYASGVPHDDYRTLRTDPLYGGREANPDGSIVLEGSARALTIFFENKTRRRRLDLEQIKRHLGVRLGDSDDARLLVITADGNDRGTLDALGDGRIHFMSWDKVSELSGNLSQVADEPKDQFLLAQFEEYLGMSNEAWRTRMPDLKLITAHAQFLKVAPEEDRFLKECQRLMDALRPDIVGVYKDEIEDASTEKPQYGRVGNECTLRKAPFGQWLFFGIYYDPRDHRIKFKIPYQAEFAIFLDIRKENRERLQKIPNVQQAIPALKNHGFEFNFPDNNCGNPWRICYWRDPMIGHEGASVNDLRTMFETQLRVLFASDFYRFASNPPKLA